MKQVQVILTLTALLFLVSAKSADAISDAGVLYLRVAPGARAGGMGEAFVSIADDATATYWNPAGLGNAPLAGTLKTKTLAKEQGDISSTVTLAGISGGNETWVIAGDQLLMFDGESWHSGQEYITSSDQTLMDVVKSICGNSDEAGLKRSAEKIIAANCSVRSDEIDAFIESVRRLMPENYRGQDELLKGLEHLKAGYEGCLLNAGSFSELKKKLDEIKKDSTITPREMDRITYSLDGAVMRYLPTRLMVPYAAGVGAKLLCLGKSERYLWVGTDDGLYRLSGRVWAKYTMNDGIPSNVVLTMASLGGHLFIGTDKGLARYFHGTFTNFEDVPQEPVEAITSKATDLAYAVIAGNLYRFDGKKWSNCNAPKLRYKATVMLVDKDNQLWVGTTSGLLSYANETWTIYGYTTFVPTENPISAEDIARKCFPGADSDKIVLLAKAIDEYNELNGQPAQPGQNIYVYNSNIGSTIHSIGTVLGELYVGTEYGLLHKTEEGWKDANFEDLNHRGVVGVYEYDNRAFYVSTRGITTETKGIHQATVMHVNWLPDLNLDMYYDFLSYVQNIRGFGTVGASLIVLNYGEIEFTGEQAGSSLGYENPFELTLALSYGNALTSNMKWGMSVKFIYSHLSTIGAAQEKGNGIASAFAADVGMLYKITDRMQFGAAVTNLGPNITYVDAAQSDPLPRNLGVGISYKIVNTAYNRLVVQYEMNKLLTDMDRSFSSQLKETIWHVGGEYWYSNLIAIRAGYKNDQDGQVKHLTLGAGLQFRMLELDFAYIPSSTDSPLANTLRISGTVTF